MPRSSTTTRFIALLACAVADSASQLWTFTSLPSLDVSITTTFTDSTSTLLGNTIGAVRIVTSAVFAAPAASGVISRSSSG